jgi:hypothetical protein
MDNFSASSERIALFERVRNFPKQASQRTLAYPVVQSLWLARTLPHAGALVGGGLELFGCGK